MEIEIIEFEFPTALLHLVSTLYVLKVVERFGKPAMCSLVPRPHPRKKEEGLAHFEPFLVFADSTVQDPGLPIRLQACDFSCDIDQLAIAII